MKLEVSSSGGAIMQAIVSTQSEEEKEAISAIINFLRMTGHAKLFCTGHTDKENGMLGAVFQLER
jgi:hypothetical protein